MTSLSGTVAMQAGEKKVSLNGICYAHYDTSSNAFNTRDLCQVYPDIIEVRLYRYIRLAFVLLFRAKT